MEKYTLDHTVNGKALLAVLLFLPLTNEDSEVHSMTLTKVLIFSSAYFISLKYG